MKNWITVNSICWEQASAVIYSLMETICVNDLDIYYYLRHLLTELPQLLQAYEKLGEMC